MSDQQVVQADAKDLPFADNSFDAMITDPPYGLAFMGKSWDDFEPNELQEFTEKWGREAIRVLKPGAHICCFGGTRTFHRIACGLEDAGFTIRDTLSWHYGGGFPKSLDISKAIDKKRDDEKEIRMVCRWLRNKIDESDVTDELIAERFNITKSQVTSHWAATDRHQQPEVPKFEQWKKLKEIIGFDNSMDDLVNWLNDRKGEPSQDYENREVIKTIEDKGDRSVDILQGSSDTYDISKPATDQAKQWDGYGTALKPSWEPIILARAPMSEDTIVDNVLEHGVGALNIDGCRIDSDRDPQSYTVDRWKPGAELKEEGGNWKRDGGDVEQVEGEMPSGRFPANTVLSHTRWCNEDGEEMDCPPSCPVRELNESANVEASRFFYCSKASRSERTMNGEVDNNHPTVKPVDLIQWLVTLVVPEDGKFIDPFAGSGTALIAANRMHRDCVGSDREEDYVEIAEERMEAETRQKSLFD